MYPCPVYRRDIYSASSSSTSETGIDWLQRDGYYKALNCEENFEAFIWNGGESEGPRAERQGTTKPTICCNYAEYHGEQCLVGLVGERHAAEDDLGVGDRLAGVPAGTPANEIAVPVSGTVATDGAPGNRLTMSA